MIKTKNQDDYTAEAEGGTFPRWAILIAIVLILNVADFTSKIAQNPKLQYLIVVVPLIFMLSGEFERKQFGKMKIVSILGSLLWFIGMSGTYWGKIVEVRTDGALPLIWPLLILGFGTYKSESNENIERGMIGIGYLATIISFEGVIARLYYPIATFNFSHEKAFLIIFSIAVGFTYKNYIMVILSSVSLILNFITYPALTYILCGLVAFLVSRMLRSKVSIVGFYIFQIVSIYFIYYSTFKISKPSGLLNSIYKSLNRDNNVGYREFLIKQVEHQISQHLFFGSLFRRSVLIETPDANLPVHNDFVTVTLGGGIFCLVLYLGIYFGTNYNIFQSLKTQQNLETRKALVCLAILVNGYFFCSAANPISMKAQNGMILTTTIYAIKYLINHQPWNRESTPLRDLG